jgi:predicted HD phosphohydrolase
VTAACNPESGTTRLESADEDGCAEESVKAALCRDIGTCFRSPAVILVAGHAATRRMALSGVNAGNYAS